MSEHAAGESISSLARKYEPSATAIRNWKRQAKLKASGAESSESKDQQLRQLRRQNEQLRQENAFLKKRPPGSPPTARSSVVEAGVPVNRDGEETLHGPLDVSGIRDFRKWLLCLAKA